MIYLYFLVNLFATAVFAVPWTCGNNPITLAPTDQPLFFPNSSFTSDYIVPQRCTWIFSILPGDYGVLHVQLNVTIGDSFTIKNVAGTYSHGLYGPGEDVPNNAIPRFYLPSGTFTMQLNVTAPGQFGFWLSSLKLPNFPVQTTTQQQTVTELSAMRGNEYLFSSTEVYTFRTITSQCNYNDYRYDTCHVYKGNRASQGIFESGLSNYVQGLPPLFLSNASVICFDDDLPTGYILVTSSPIVFENSTWQVVTDCDYLEGNTLNLYNQGIGSPSAYISTYCPNGCTKYVEAIETASQVNTSLTLFSGLIGPSDGELAKILASDGNTKLPQQMPTGVWNTFSVDFGDMSFILDSNPKKWTTASVRSGFYASPYYGTITNVKNTSTTISSSKWNSFTYSVRNIDGGNLQISFDQGNGKESTTLITSTNVKENGVGSATGYGMTIIYGMDSGTTGKGVLMYYEITAGSGRSISLWFVFLVLLRFGM